MFFFFFTFSSIYPAPSVSYSDDVTSLTCMLLLRRIVDNVGGSSFDMKGNAFYLLQHALVLILYNNLLDLFFLFLSIGLLGLSSFCLAGSLDAVLIIKHTCYIILWRKQLLVTQETQFMKRKGLC